MATLSFRPLVEADLQQLATWLHADHVQRWWRDSSDLERVQEKYRPRIEGKEPTEVFVIVADDKDVGIIQRYRLAAYPDWDGTIAGTGLAFENAAGIDYLIGESDHVGRGTGTEAVRYFTQILFTDWPDVDQVIVTPQTANRASCRVLEKAGYVSSWTGLLDSDDPADADVASLYLRRR